MEKKKYTRKYYPTSIYTDIRLLNFIEFKASQLTAAPSRNRYINYILNRWALDNGYEVGKIYKK